MGFKTKVVSGPAKPELSRAEQAAITDAKQRSAKREPAFKLGCSFEQNDAVATLRVVDPGTVQRISRPFDGGASGIAAVR